MFAGKQQFFKIVLNSETQAQSDRQKKKMRPQKIIK